MKRTIITYMMLFISCIIASAQNHETIDSVVVTDYRPRADKKTQTSMMKIDRKDFRFKAVMGTPDVIKTLQMLPGVTPGNEMSSTINVRGGTGNDNLYLLDNVPLYQSGHFLGLFSVFNTDMIEWVDFYKGGFPAQFGGRASSVVDVKMKDGDMHGQHGSFSLGMTDGRFQIEGPIKEGVLSYNVAVRYGWVEAFVRPLLKAIYVPNVSYSNDYTRDGHYGFSDLNAKFTWKKSSRDKITFNTYLGFDYMSFMDSEKNALGGGSSDYLKTVFKDANRWGNALLSAVWERDFSQSRKMKSTFYFSDGYYNAFHEDLNKFSDYKSYDLESNVSNIADVGAKIHFSDKTFSRHYLNYGASAVYHLFSPVALEHSYTQVGSVRSNEAKVSYGCHYHSPEIALYAEDEFTLSPHIFLNAGLRYMLFVTKGQTYNSLEPRLALSYDPNRTLSAKVSYSEMTQPVHQVESFKTERPGSFWMPATAAMKPIRSRIVSAETEWRPNHHVLFNVAGFWKGMSHLYEYTGNNNLPSPAAWETEFTEGKGRSFGLEFYGEFQSEKWDVSTAYTLSWSQRRFEAFYSGWYRDRYDNRHNLVINGVYKAHPLVDIYATWILRSGNRYTIPLYGYYMGTESLYPNNFQLPAYHRLDVGIDFRAVSARKGRDYIVTFAVYNLYGRKNPFYISIVEDVYRRPTIKMTSIFPILPSVRYTLYF